MGVFESLARASIVMYVEIVRSYESSSLMTELFITQGNRYVTLKYDNLESDESTYQYFNGEFCI